MMEELETMRPQPQTRYNLPIQIKLSRELRDALDKKSEETGAGISEIVRRCIAKYVDVAPTPEEEEAAYVVELYSKMSAANKSAIVAVMEAMTRRSR